MAGNPDLSCIQFRDRLTGAEKRASRRRSTPTFIFPAVCTAVARWFAFGAFYRLR